jgi:hypothetical protein
MPIVTVALRCCGTTSADALIAMERSASLAILSAACLHLLRRALQLAAAAQKRNPQDKKRLVFSLCPAVVTHSEDSAEDW